MIYEFGPDATIFFRGVESGLNKLTLPNFYRRDFASSESEILRYPADVCAPSM